MNDLLFLWEILPFPAKLVGAVLIGTSLGLTHAWLRHLDHG